MSHVLVIGNGAAGTFSSWLLARKGWKVTMVGRGTPGAALSTGCLRSVPSACRGEISEFLDNEHMPWAAGEREGASRIGTSFRCWMSPSHTTWTDDEKPKSIAVAGLEGHPSLQIRVASALLNERGVRAEPFMLPGSVPSDVPLTSWFRNDEAWEELAEDLQRSSAEAILLPAIVHLHEYPRLDRLERRCGRRVLEAVSPLGAPGQRLADLMLSKARSAGTVVWDGRKVSALEVQADEVRGATIIGGSEARHVATDAVVIATGGPLVDGLVLDGRKIMDPFGRFQTVRRGDALRGGYHCTNGKLISTDGRVMTNTVGAGDCLSAERREYGSGLTEALESAYRAVRALEDA